MRPLPQALLPTTPARNVSLSSKLNLDPAYKVLKNYYGLGQTGELLLVHKNQSSRQLTLISPVRGDTASAIKRFAENESEVEALNPVFEDKSISLHGQDYRGQKVLQTARKIKNTDIALWAKNRPGGGRWRG